MENLRKDLEAVMTAVTSLDGVMQVLSQRVAWSEVCFRQVQDSGAMHMADMVKKVMTDHDKLKSQISMLTIRVASLASQGDDGSRGGSSQPTARLSMPKFGN